MIPACRLCPRDCGVPRGEKGSGVCRRGSEMRVARAALHFKTDNEKLFAFSLEEFAACDLEIRNETWNLHEHGPVGIMTGYEEKFYALGTPIHRCECIVHSKPAPEEQSPAEGSVPATSQEI